MYGIKSKSCLHTLNFSHTADRFPADLAHDFFESIAIDILTKILGRLVESSILTLDMLNDATNGFECCKLDKQYKRQEFKVIISTKFKIKETACEMWNLIRLIPLMIGEHVVKGYKIWEILILFCQ